MQSSGSAMVWPSVFISHGSPLLPLERIPAVDYLRKFAEIRPRGILVISAHWVTERPWVTGTSGTLGTIHDFQGFPRRLYELRYPAPGDPALAERVVEALGQAGIPVGVDPVRGLDHGAWNPLLLMAPAADSPVVQLSIQPHLGLEHHVRMGQALAGLRQEGILIVASGGAVHNLRAFGGQAVDAEPVAWAQSFDTWLADRIQAGDWPSLLNYRQLAPEAALNHPTDEHLVPLYVALGAGGEGAQGIPLHQSFTHGVLSMASFGFGSPAELARLQAVVGDPVALAS